MLNHRSENTGAVKRQFHRDPPSGVHRRHSFIRTRANLGAGLAGFSIFRRNACAFSNASPMALPQLVRGASCSRLARGTLPQCHHCSLFCSPGVCTGKQESCFEHGTGVRLHITCRTPAHFTVPKLRLPFDNAELCDHYSGVTTEVVSDITETSLQESRT